MIQRKVLVVILYSKSYFDMFRDRFFGTTAAIVYKSLIVCTLFMTLVHVL